MESNNKYLGSEKVSKLLFKFSIPCILSLLISSLYNIVDQIFIGNSELGYLGNAATERYYQSRWKSWFFDGINSYRRYYKYYFRSLIYLWI